MVYFEYNEKTGVIKFRWKKHHIVTDLLREFPDVQIKSAGNYIFDIRRREKGTGKMHIHKILYVTPDSISRVDENEWPECLKKQFSNWIAKEGFLKDGMADDDEFIIDPDKNICVLKVGKETITEITPPAMKTEKLAISCENKEKFGNSKFVLFARGYCDGTFFFNKDFFVFQPFMSTPGPETGYDPMDIHVFHRNPMVMTTLPVAGKISELTMDQSMVKWQRSVRIEKIYKK